MSGEKIKLILYWSGLAFFLLLELRESYRPATVSKLQRWLTHLPLSIANGLFYHMVYTAPLGLLLLQNEAGRHGLLNSYDLPYWLKMLFTILILDFVIYIWHLLNHEVPLFWRFHRVHHSDLNMDASTANRFHLGELLFSGLLRLAVVYTFGLPAAGYILFEILANLSIQFHHSSIRMPADFEKRWMLLFVPPSMHRVHHSVKIRERDSNYGVLFSLWDRLLGTLTQGVDQDGIVIGLGEQLDVEFKSDRCNVFRGQPCFLLNWKTEKQRNIMI